MPGEQESTIQLLLTEYQSVKEEQRARIGLRDNLLYVALAAVVAVVATTLQARHTGLLLALPPVCLVLGWTYLVNDEKISAIGHYVRSELAPRLATLTGTTDTPVFGWEIAHRSDHRRSSRKAIQSAVDLMAFCLVPSAALCVFWSLPPTGGPLFVLSLAESFAIVGLATEIVLYAHFPSTIPQVGGTPRHGPDSTE